MTDKADKKEKKELLELRISLLRKELVTDKDGKPVTDSEGTQLETHTQHTHFEITDQALAQKISELLADALTKDHIEDVPKYPEGHAQAGEPILDAHKFELTGKAPKKKKPAA